MSIYFYNFKFYTDILSNTKRVVFLTLKLDGKALGMSKTLDHIRKKNIIQLKKPY